MRKPYIPPTQNGRPRQMPLPKLDPETGCWIWQGSLVEGYGKISGGKGKGPAWTHRFYWEYEKGEIPPKIDVHHKCGNRACVNTDHLELLTRHGHGLLATNAKLNIDQVREIRQRFREGEAGNQLAKEFGVHRVTIGNLLAGRTWQDDVVCPSCGHRFDPYSH